jgi:hypothetical protein
MYENISNYENGTLLIQDFSNKVLLCQKDEYQFWVSGNLGTIIKQGTEPIFAENISIQMALYDWNAFTGDSLTMTGVELLYGQKNNMA